MNQNQHFLSLLDIEAFLQLCTFLGTCAAAFYSGAIQKSKKERIEQRFLGEIDEELNTISEMIREHLAKMSTIIQEIENRQEQFSDFSHRNTGKLEELNYTTQEILNNVKAIANINK